MNLEGSVRLRVTVSLGGMAKSSEVLGGNAVFSKAARRMRFYEEMGARPQETQVVVNLSFHPQPFILKHFLILQLLETPVSRPSLTALWGIVIAITLARSSCHGCASVSW